MHRSSRGFHGISKRWSKAIFDSLDQGSATLAVLGCVLFAAAAELLGWMRWRLAMVCLGESRKLVLYWNCVIYSSNWSF